MCKDAARFPLQLELDHVAGRVRSCNREDLPSIYMQAMLAEAFMILEQIKDARVITYLDMMWSVSGIVLQGTAIQYYSRHCRMWGWSGAGGK